MKVLIAGAVAAMLARLESMVTEWGYEAVKAHGASEAFEILLVHRAPRLALFDASIDATGGLELLRALRAAERAAETRNPSYAILAGAGDRPKDAAQALEAGASDYLRKPVFDRELRARLAAGVRVIELQESLAERPGPKTIEAGLTRDQNLLRILMDHAADAIYFKDAESRFVRISKALAERLGLADPDQAVGKTDRDFYSADHAGQAREDERRIMATGEPVVSKEERETWPDGRVTWVTSTKMPLRTPEGAITGTFGISRDISGYKRVEDELRLNERQYRFQSLLLQSIFEVSPDGILVVDRSGMVLSHNRRFLEIWRLDESCVGREDSPVLAAVAGRLKDPVAFRRRVESLYADPSAEDHCELELSDGRTVDRTSTALEGEGREYMGRVWFFRDITKRKREGDAQAEQARLSGLRAEVGSALMGRGSLRAGLQKCAVAALRWTNVAFVGLWLREPGGATLELEAGAGAFGNTTGLPKRIPVGSFRIGRIAEQRVVYLNNDVRHDPEVAGPDWNRPEGLVSFLGRPLVVRNEVAGVIAAFGRRSLTAADTVAFAALASQIAQFIDARRAEEALHRSEERARLLFQAIPHSAYVFDLDTLEFLEVNQRAMDHYGFTREEFLSMKTSDIRSPEEAARLKSYLATDLSGERADWKHRLKDGRIIDVEITYHPIDYRGRRAALTIAQDVTERRKFECDLRHSQKLESVGQLASGIAHEINTPIQFIGDNLRFLSDSFTGIEKLLAEFRKLAASAAAGLPAKLDQAAAAADLEYLSEEIPKALVQSLDGVGRVATIVKAMKDFAHPQQNQRMPANLNEALKSTLVVAGNEFKYMAEVETDFGSIPMVDCHLSDLNQVFLNLLINASHAIADAGHHAAKKGKIRIETRQEGDCVRIAIADSGCGIPERIRDKIFDPFFTTKEVGRGTGQGLAISRSIVVDKHGGSLTFETEMGRGTTFFITLPITEPHGDSAGGGIENDARDGESEGLPCPIEPHAFHTTGQDALVS